MSSAYPILPGLADRLGTPLPAPRQLSWIAAKTEEDYPDLALACELSELEEGRVQPDRAARLSEDDANEPSEKAGSLSGGSLSCWIEWSRHGRLGGVIWSAAS